MKMALMGLLLAGCVIARPITAPNGQPGYALTCNGAQGWAGCYAKAGEVCPGGYSVVAQDGQTGQVVTGSMNSGTGHLIGVPVAHRSLIVACR